jgi:hypothetical protein
MPGSVIGTSLNYGFAGTIASTPDIIIQSKPVNSASANIPFGSPVIQNSDDTVTFGGATLTAANFAGVATAEVKQLLVLALGTNGTGSGYYQPGKTCEIIQRGKVSVKVYVGSPTTGAKAYVRVALNGSIPNGIIGGFEAAADGSNTIQLTNAVWDNGHVDANGVTSLKILSLNV